MGFAGHGATIGDRARSLSVRHLLRKAAPLKNEITEVEISEETLSRYTQWQNQAGIAALGLLVPSVLFFWTLFLWLGASRAGNLPSAEYLFVPNSMIWLLPAIFMGSSLPLCCPTTGCAAS